jgi:hypothetical protein
MTSFRSSRAESREDSKAFALSDRVAFALTVFMGLLVAQVADASWIDAHDRTIALR